MKPNDELIAAARALCEALKKTDGNQEYNYLWSLGAPAYYYKRPDYSALVERLEEAINEKAER